MIVLPFNTNIYVYMDRLINFGKLVLDLDLEHPKKEYVENIF